MMRAIRIMYGLSLRLLPIALGVVGWFVAHWLGMIAGVLIGCVLALLIWMNVHLVWLSSRHARQMIKVKKLPTEKLIELATDPTSGDLAFAMSELDRRGIEARPSIASLRDLLTSPNVNRRGLGLTLFMALYPEVWSKIAKRGSSSADPPEAWRERLAGIEQS